MSGIAGIYNTDGRPVETKDLERMVEVLAHRGPEGSGIWRDGAVGLAHRMFHETPESLHEHQPYEDKAAQLVITADARIDNRDELIHKLDLTKEDPLYISDSQLILLSYAKWGEDCVDHLLGDFAFVIWDGRKRSLFCARDYMGIKPFYYCFHDNCFLFASELKGIFCVRDVSPEISKEMIASYLLVDFDDRESTLFEGLYRLPSAHVMRVDQNGIHKRCYWKADPSYELRLKSDAEYAEKFREIFAEAVRCRLRSAFPVGSTLSGGMDSSSITCMARDLLKQERKGRLLKTFSATFSHLPRVDEQKYQNSVIVAGAIEPFLVPMDNIGPFEAYVHGQQFMEFPYFGTTYYLHYGMHKEMKNQGVRISLDGHGGDDVVGHGYSYLDELSRNFNLFKFYSKCRDISKVHKIPLSKLLWRVGIRSNIPQWFVNIYRLLRNRPINQSSADKFPIVKDFLLKTQNGKQIQDKELSQNRSLNARAEHAQLFTKGLYSSIFEMYDQMTYGFSIIMRYPFFDKRLGEFCLSLPHDQKISKGYTRVILRRAMEGILPKEIQWRPGKSDLSPHFYQILRGKELAYLDEFRQNIPQLLDCYINKNLFKEKVEAFIINNKNNFSFCTDLWPIITLGIWMRSQIQTS